MYDVSLSAVGGPPQADPEYPLPTEHPMWETQVALERGMGREGYDNARDLALEAEKYRHMTTLGPIRGLMEDWLPQVAQGVIRWRQAFQSTRGPRPIAYDLLQGVDPYVASLIAVRAVLDTITSTDVKFTRLAIEVGLRVEHEKQVRLWEARNPELFRTVQHHLKTTKATQGHRAKVNINRFNTLLKDGDTFDFDWRYWTPEEHLRVGIALLETVIQVTGWFEYASDPDHRPSAKRPLPSRIIVPKPELLEWIAKGLDQHANSSALCKPTVVPPRRWQGTRSGAYWTPYVRPPRLIRFRSSSPRQRGLAADEYDAIDMPKVLTALHFLQEVPWAVNHRVLFVAEHVLAQDLGLAKMPSAEKIQPEPPPGLMAAAPRSANRRGRKGARGPHHTVPHLDGETGEVTATYAPEPRFAPLTASELAGAKWMAENPKAVKAWKRKAAAAYRDDFERAGRYRLASRTIRIAREYAAFDRHYYPHMLDFRGRMYPIPIGLQPQGDDLARGLLQYADGKIATETNGGARWLAIHLASVWGKSPEGKTLDKLPMEERFAWTCANEALLRRIDADPLANTEWSRAEKPWQTLAAVYEWVGYLKARDRGLPYVSRLPVMVDGTCNGIQHLAAMTRDELAGAYVNLTPSERPQDIYKFVAQRLQEAVELDEETKCGLPQQHASYWLNLTGRDLPRGLTKRQVMVLPYGGTFEAYLQYTREWLDEADPLDLSGDDLDDDEVKALRTERSQRIVYLSKHLWEAVTEAVSGGVAVMKWLKDCARPAAKSNLPIYWVTPSGFVVRHFYGKRKAKRVKTLLDGAEVRLYVNEVTEEMDTESQLRGVAPNFVHSLDAAALALTLVRAQERGLTGFSAIHDAYGTHAADMDSLFVILRGAFVEVHSVPVLEVFREFCRRVLRDMILGTKGGDYLGASEAADEALPSPLAMGSLDLGEVLRSPYFFAP